MGRTILPGWRVRIAATAHPVPGAIWAYCDDQGRVMVHRCLGRQGAGFVFKGDGLAASDPPVAADVLIGAVVAVDDGVRVRRIGLADRLWQGLPRRMAFAGRAAAARWRTRIGRGRQDS